MTEVNRKIHVLGINSYVFEDLPSKLQALFIKTRNIAVPNSYFEEIKSSSDNVLEKKKAFFASKSNNELIKWLKSQKNDFFCSKLCLLQDWIFSKYELGTAIETVSRNRFCNLRGKSSNL